MSHHQVGTPRGETGQLHYAAEPGEEGSVATLLDVVRGLLVDAFEEGRRPDEVVLGAALYDTVSTAKAREVRRGGQVTLLGLRVSAAEATSPAGHSRAVGS